MTTSYYQYHVFFCLNRRDDGSACCAEHNAESLFDYCKAKIKALGLASAGQVRINRAGCLDRCELGPVLVVYPQGVWYSYVDQHDIDEIIEKHLQGNEIVERLLVS